MFRTSELWTLLSILLISTSITEIRGILTPQEMLDKVVSLQKQAEDLPPLLYETSCVPEDEKVYKYVRTKIYQEKEDELFGPSPANDPIVQLSLLLDRVNKITQANNGKPKEEKVGILCSIQNGLACTTENNINICKCNTLDGLFKNAAVYDSSTMKCVIKWKGQCDSSLPVECEEPAGCFLTPGDEVPDELIFCTDLNRWALDLKDDYSCSCEYTEETRLARMRSLQDNLVNTTYLTHEKPCKFQPHEDLFGLNGLVASFSKKISSFYQNPGYQRLEEEYHNYMKNPVPIFCDLKESLFCYKDKEKCDCFSPAVYNTAMKRCILPKLSPCPGEGNRYPYSCENGTRCVFEDVDVLCTDESKLDIMDYGLIVSAKCTCNAKEFKHSFNPEIIKDMQIKAKATIDRTVHTLNNTLWTVLDYGQPCNWTNDRRYFEMQDFIFAGKENVYSLMQNFKHLEQESVSKEFKRFEICDLKKSMRCGFLSKKCECGSAIYFADIITSNFDEVEQRCILPPGSRCHSTLSEWLPCQDNEACTYDAVPVLCNRKNKQVAIKNRLRFRTAACSCQPKELSQTEFNEDAIQNYSVKRIHEEF